MSQATRKITYGSTTNYDAPKVIYSNTTTWGALKSENQELALTSNGMSVVVFGGNKITSDSDILPTGDFQLCFVLDKNNSGGDN